MSFVRFIPGCLVLFDDCHRLGLSEADEKTFGVQAISLGISTCGKQGLKAALGRERGQAVRQV